MKALFLITWRQWLRGGARTWFTAVSALVCSAMLAAVQFGGASLAASSRWNPDFPRSFWRWRRQSRSCWLCFSRYSCAEHLLCRSRSARGCSVSSPVSGATRRQLRRSVWLDALLLSVFAAPLGVLCAAEASL